MWNLYRSCVPPPAKMRVCVAVVRASLRARVGNTAAVVWQGDHECERKRCNQPSIAVPPQRRKHTMVLKKQVSLLYMFTRTPYFVPINLFPRNRCELATGEYHVCSPTLGMQLGHCCCQLFFLFYRHLDKPAVLFLRVADAAMAIDVGLIRWSFWSPWYSV